MMFEDERVLVQPQHLAIDVAIAIGVLQLVLELDPIGVLLDRPFTRVDNLVSLEALYWAAFCGLRTAPTPMRTNVSPGLASS